VKPVRPLERSRKEAVVERQADQYQAGEESTTTTSVAAGDGGWTGARTTIVGGLAVFVVLGLVANIPGEGALQDLLHAVSSIGLVVAATLLALGEARRGGDLVAAGFAILAVAQVVMWAGAGPGGEASFAAAALFFAPALFLISLPPRFAFWARIAGALAAIPFGAHGIAYLLNGSPPEGLLNAEGNIAYPVLIIAVIGWAVDVFRSTRAARKGSP
jgi:hypothetical protein